MSQAEHDRRVDYVEFPATDVTATKTFYEGNELAVRTDR